MKMRLPGRSLPTLLLTTGLTDGQLLCCLSSLHLSPRQICSLLLVILSSGYLREAWKYLIVLTPFRFPAAPVHTPAQFLLHVT